MIKKKILFIFSIILIIVTAFNGCSKSNDITSNDNKRNITIIVKMKEGNYWNTVRQGADAAAKEFNANVSFIAADNETDIDDQIKLVNGAIENNVDAIILAASDYEGLGKITDTAHSKKIPVIAIDTEVDSKYIKSFIGTDNVKAGEKAGEALVNVAGVNSNVAIMNFVEGAKNAKQREEGLNKVLSRYPDIKIVAKKYCNSDADTAEKLTKELIQTHENLNAIVALNEAASLGVSKAIDSMKLGGKIKVVAFDNAPEEINLLESGVIQKTIIQNPFSIGYFGVKYAVDSIDGKKIPKEVDTGSKVIDKDNLYLQDNQKLIFPFIK